MKRLFAIAIVSAIAWFAALAATPVRPGTVTVDITTAPSGLVRAVLAIDLRPRSTAGESKVPYRRNSDRVR